MNNQQTQNGQGAQDSNIPVASALITRALGYTENGGAPNLSNPSSGKTGEMKSIFQYEPATWKADAQKFLGDANAQLTPDNETKVAQSQVTEWLQKGYKVPQIASMWNAGVGEPDAYTGKFSDGSSSQGTNKEYGVKYDVPGYANKVTNYVKQFMQEAQQSQNGQQNNQQPQKVSQAPQEAKSKGRMNGLASGSMPQPSSKLLGNRKGLLGGLTSLNSTQS